MAKPTEKLPLQFYIQRFHGPDMEVEADDETADDALVLNELVTKKLKSTYHALWTILTRFASQSQSQTSRERFASKYFFETHAVPGHPDVFLRCQVVEDKWLALVLEQTIKEPTFAGRAGLILGARGSGKTILLRERHAHPTIEVDITRSARLFHVHSSSLQQHADEILANLVSNPSDVTRVHDWFEETEKVITIPEKSLRETTYWLNSLNQEIARERDATQALALSQSDEFMRLFASLADTRLGA